MGFGMLVYTGGLYGELPLLHADDVVNDSTRGWACPTKSWMGSHRRVRAWRETRPAGPAVISE